MIDGEPTGIERIRARGSQGVSGTTVRVRSARSTRSSSGRVGSGPIRRWRRCFSGWWSRNTPPAIPARFHTFIAQSSAAMSCSTAGSRMPPKSFATAGRLRWFSLWCKATNSRPMKWRGSAGCSTRPPAGHPHHQAQAIAKQQLIDWHNSRLRSKLSGGNTDAGMVRGNNDRGGHSGLGGDREQAGCGRSLRRSDTRSGSWC